jgi:hypothetical protein
MNAGFTSAVEELVDDPKTGAEPLKLGRERQSCGTGTNH